MMMLQPQVGWVGHGRRSLRLERGERGGGWCWQIGLRGGVCLRSGRLFEVIVRQGEAGSDGVL